ncbi:MAG: hypothetical protein HUU01_01445 [Saprospiraceae bacterium]|nr:hypothetical protein [Saprospiraceae bacterium]
MTLKPLFSIAVIWLLAVFGQGYGQTLPKQDSLLKLAKETRSDTARVWALMETGKLFLNKQADTADYYLSQALQLAERIHFERGIARCRINKAVGLYDLGKFDTVLVLCKSSIPICEKLKMGKELVAVYNMMGNTWNLKGNFWLAIEFFEKCLEAMKTATVPPHFPVVVNDNLSILYINLHLYDKALFYASGSLQLAEEIGDEATIGTACQHIGSAYLGLQQKEKALGYFQRAVDIARKLDYPRLFTTSISNVAEIMAFKGDHQKAKSLYKEGLKVSREHDDREGLVYNLHGLSLEAFHESDYPAAKAYAKEGLSLAQEMQLSSYSYALYLTLSDIALLEGDSKTYTAYRDRYRELRDSVASGALVHALQELETKYETEKKEQRITQLEQEKELQQLRIRQKNSLIWGLALAAIGLVILAVLLRRNFRNGRKILDQELLIHRQKIRELEQERQLNIADAILQGQEKERGRLARDLHDGLGGMLSGIKQSLFALKENPALSNTSTLALGQVIGELDHSISELRHIARNMMPEALVRFGLKDALEDYCDHLRLADKLEIHFQAFGMDDRLNQETEVVVFRIAQELLNNVVRHSGATQVLVQLLRDGNRVNLTVEDNGKGFDATSLDRVQGIGWMNIRSRVNYLDGNLDVRTEPGKGCSITTEFEIS